MIRFLVDEGCDAIVVRTLRSLEYDVQFVAELSPGISDEAVLEWANRESRILVVEDNDFGELIFREKKATFGTVLLRIPDALRHWKATRMIDLVTQHAEEISKSMTTVTIDAIRIRSIST